MPAGLRHHSDSLVLLSLSLSVTSLGLVVIPAEAAAAPFSRPPLKRGNNNPLGIDWNPAPSPEDGPPGARDALRNPAYLPAQIGGIVGSYAFSLVVVALTLLALSKRRRERLRAAEEFDLWEEVPHFTFDFPDSEPAFRSREGLFDVGPHNSFHVTHELPKSPGHRPDLGHVRNFSLPSPTSLRFEIPNLEIAPEAKSPSSYTLPSPTSTTRGPLGQDPYVDQGIVRRDKVMAQSQLEEMYKYVMEQEEAKEAGVEFQGPALPYPAQQQQQQRDSSITLKKGRNKPANLNLGKSEKPQSRASSILSALKSPLGKKKNQVQGISISSPIMTPMSATFPQYAGEEMNAIPPRQYAPARPPPVPTDQLPSFSERRNTGHIAPLTPSDLSPESTQSIDGRIGAIATTKGKDRDGPRGEDVSEDEDEGRQDQDSSNYHHHHNNNYSHPHSRHISLATTEADPVSAVSETSQSPLVRHTAIVSPPTPRASGLPTSPKPGMNRFPSLPASPKPGATFLRANAPSAVRTGGALPLRAYEPGLMSPSTYDRTVKQTVFERAGPRSPGGMHTTRTPMTGNPVPYSPYQPFSPVVPITPSLVTKADRKMMRRMEPKTPTLQMVKSDDELW